MTISFVGATKAEATSVTLPTHQVGDTIVVAAYRRDGATAITIPSGWRVVGMRRANTQALYIAQKVAASTSEVSGTWTGAELMIAGVWRDPDYYVTPGGFNAAGSASTTTLTYSNIDAAVTTTLNLMRQSDGTSYVVGICGVTLNSTNADLAPSGMTNRDSIAGASVGELTMHDTAAGVSSWSSTTTTASSTVGFAAITFELFISTIAKSSGSGGLSPSLINNQSLVRGIVI